MTDLEALARLAQEEKRLWAGYGRGDGKNDADYLVAHQSYHSAASPDVVLALVRVALAAKVITDRPGVWDAGGDAWWDAHEALRAALVEISR